MYLKSLTLRGFKSFASSTTLSFEPGITCVVGPNGSGKSNVVDALSWVMGEQGAKTVRGGKMEDVIFAGTVGRAPLGRAEVILTIDNADGALPIEYSEVTISRTMFRTGGSEYAINGTSTRLLDVQELLSDSGIGREMHVIVGQGQLDGILQATPEIRRGFIEEAAGVLKHRKRKEKAQRKLEATAVNLNRLTDLLAEIRRQLKPLGRQAEVARRAAVIQADLRDAKARLLADDYVRVSGELASDLAAEAAVRARRLDLEQALEVAREAEQAADLASRQALPRLASAQETWYALAALRERNASTATIAAERLRNAESAAGEERGPGRDPEMLEREAAGVRQAEAALAAEVAARAAALAEATALREAAEAGHLAAEKQFQAQQRAVADRREGLARLAGEVGSLRSRVEAAGAEIERLSVARLDAGARAAAARRDFAELEQRLAALSAGESGLDADHEAAQAQVVAVQTVIADLEARELAVRQERAALSARAEALSLGLARKDGAAALLEAGEVDGLVGSVAALLTVTAGYEVAVSAALGAAADAVAVKGPHVVLDVFGHLKVADLGRAGLLLGGDRPASDPAAWPQLPEGARYAVELVQCSPELRPAVSRALYKIAVVADLSAAANLVAQCPDVTAVTREGDFMSDWFASGGSPAKPSLIELQAAHDDASTGLAATAVEAERLRFALAQQQNLLVVAQERRDAALTRLHESDAGLAALAEEAGQLGQAIRAAEAEAGRLASGIESAERARADAEESRAGLEQRLELASVQTELHEADPGERDQRAEIARAARAAEMEARLALRTLEERARALAGRADSLGRAAEAERSARARAAARREQLRREAVVAAAVQTASGWLTARIQASLALADAERIEAQRSREAAERELAEARQRGRDLARQFESLVDAVHRDELARAQAQAKLDSLAERALTDLGLEVDGLVAEYGPDQLIPSPGGSLEASGDSSDGRTAFVRAEQEKRLRAAERDLAVLGRVNPLALEEFDALAQRHSFLAEQIDDLRKTRVDLSDIIDEVDRRVQEVFAAAYADVEREFTLAFARLFPGGEGRLVLTEPGQWLTTGVDVEARPAGKKVKRLSLLSGGERALVAVAFLVALFKARPSPFYILDEVEAALDDVNLGRLLEIYEELRASSQLLVITHQKRTMEIADALYGVTMRPDGVSTVISQRLREA